MRVRGREPGAGCANGRRTCGSNSQIVQDVESVESEGFLGLRIACLYVEQFLSSHFVCVFLVYRK